MSESQKTGLTKMECEQLRDERAQHSADIRTFTRTVATTPYAEVKERLLERIEKAKSRIAEIDEELGKQGASKYGYH